MLNKLVPFLHQAIQSRRIVFDLACRDFKSRYLGSYLGIVWAFINPLVTILVFWFIFDMGFKSKPVADFPYILWLVSGIVPWFFFSDAWTSAATAIIESQYLVSKVVFRVSLLPIVKIASTFVVHLFLVFVTMILFLLYGRLPTLTYLQIPYYIFSMLVLLLGLAWLTSAVTVFVRDLGHLIRIILQLLFWLTPILWSIDILPKNFQNIIKYNPVYYIVQGYRNCFISNQWFWDAPYEAACYWIITCKVLMLGANTFKILRPHFSDDI